MRKYRKLCPSCNIRKDEDLFDEDLGICRNCSDAAHEAALAECAQRERLKNAPVDERKVRVAEQESNRSGARDVKPPRLYPYPWGPKNGKR